MIFLLERGADMEAKNHVSYSKSIPLNKVKYLMFQHPSDYPSFMRSTPHTSAECFLDNECASPHWCCDVLTDLCSWSNISAGKYFKAEYSLIFYEFTIHSTCLFPSVIILSVHTQRGCTSLIYAADNGNIEVATFLIHRGTDIELKNNVSVLEIGNRAAESSRE